MGEHYFYSVTTEWFDYDDAAFDILGVYTSERRARDEAKAFGEAHRDESYFIKLRRHSGADPHGKLLETFNCYVPKPKPSSSPGFYVLTVDIPDVRFDASD